MRIFIAISLIGLAVWIALTPLSLILQNTPLNTISAVSAIVDENILQQVDNPLMLYALVIADVIIGGILILAAVIILIGKDRIGTFLALISSLILISIVNLFVFYYDQFSSIAIATVEFLILFIVIRYRIRFIRKTTEGSILV